MATADEILAGAVEVASEVVTEDRVLRIDNELRTISIPSAVKILGVESDEDVNVIEFEMPRYHGEFDLSEFSVRVNYLNANSEGDIYRVTDLSVGEQTMTFSWLVGRFASAYKGAVQFIVCLKKLTEELVVEKEFNTTLAYLPVLEGLETDQQVIQNYPDIIEQMLKYMETPVSSEEIGKAVEEYLKENPAGGATINDEEVSAGSVWSSQKTSSQIDTKISYHNTDQTTHADIRDLIVGLTNRLNALADSDDTTLDQLSEIVAYIKSNKSLIDAITTSKVSVSDIVDDLVTNSSNKPLSAAQGVKLKALIDAIVPVTVDAALSSTSTNPVQNKVVFSALNAVKPPIDDTVTAEDKLWSSKKTSTQLNTLSGQKVNKSGWTAGKYLGTDENGNVVEKEGMAGGLTSDPQEGTEAPEMGSVPINADQLGGKTYQMIVDLIYPIGRTITTLDDDDNPNTLYPWQTWEQTAKGRMIIGTGANEANTNTTYGSLAAGTVNRALGEMGGEEKHKLTVDEMANHTHNVELYSVVGDNTTALSWKYEGFNNGEIAPAGKVSYTGGDKPHNNMSPYLAANIWKRVS